LTTFTIYFVLVDFFSFLLRNRLIILIITIITTINIINQRIYGHNLLLVSLVKFHQKSKNNGIGRVINKYNPYNADIPYDSKYMFI